MEAVAVRKDVSQFGSATFFASSCEMPLKAKSNRGRPPGLSISQDRIVVLRDQLKDAIDHLEKTLSFMQENNLPAIDLTGAKVFAEHAPVVQSFCRRLYAEAGPALASHRLGEKSRLQQNQERYAKAKKSKR